MLYCLDNFNEVLFKCMKNVSKSFSQVVQGKGSQKVNQQLTEMTISRIVENCPILLQEAFYHQNRIWYRQ